MIAIKGMDMPKSCKECDFYLLGENSCSRTGFIINCNNNIMDKNCPLIDLGSEDMSWEELVNKCKSEFSQKNFQYEENQFGYSKKHITKINFLIEDENYPDEVGCIRFREDCVVECGAYAPSEGFFKSKIKPFQMWQIIQALVGER